MSVFESKMSKEYQKKTVSVPLYLYIIMSILGVFFTLILILVGAIFYESNQLSIKSLDREFKLSEALTQRTFDYRFDPAFTMLDTGTSLPVDFADIHDDEQTANIFLQKLVYPLIAYPESYYVSYSFNDGSFFYMVALHSANMRKQYNAAEGVEYVFGLRCQMHDGCSQNIISFYDGALNKLETKPYVFDYKMHEQEWYTNALDSSKVQFSNATSFHMLDEQGLILAKRLPARNGVFSISFIADGLLEVISHTLFEQKISLFTFDEGDVSSYYAYSVHDELIEEYAHDVFVGKTQINFDEYPKDMGKMQILFDKIAKHEVDSRTTMNTPVTVGGHEFMYYRSLLHFGENDLNLYLLVNSSEFTGTIGLFFREALLVIILYLACIFLPLALWLSLRISRPLSLITMQAEKMSDNNFDDIIPTQSSILEICNLEASINDMQRKIQKYTKDLEDNQGNLQRAVEERTNELQKAVIFANESTEAKGRFLSVMSHELHTPMHSILGFLYSFETKNLTEDQKSRLEKIQFAAESLLIIIDDILDFSKLEIGKLSIETAPFSLKELLNKVINITEHTAREKNLPLRLETSENIPNMIMGDAVRLRKVLINLLSNAIKFTETGEVVLLVNEIDVEIEAGLARAVYMEFIVRDTGIGMTSEQIELLFQAFSQVDTSMARKFGGSGLGLIISKQLVSLMGGDIEVRSTPQEGSEFVVSVKFQLALEGVKKNVLAQKIYTYRKKARALVVDDHQVNLEVACVLLAKLGIETDIVMNGNDALEMATNNAYDIIFMDMQMPEMDGLEVSKRMRILAGAATKVSTVPIITMTANVLEEDQTRCYEAGMNDLLAKPIMPQKLLEILAKYIPE